MVLSVLVSLVVISVFSCLIMICVDSENILGSGEGVMFLLLNVWLMICRIVVVLIEVSSGVEIGLVFIR